MKNTGTFNFFMNDVSRTPLLSRDEEAALVRKARAGDIRARNTLVNANIRFVVTIAKEYHYTGLDLEDLVNEGCIGLMNAIERFDCSWGNRLITYASWWIQQSIGRAICERGRTIRLPQGKVKELGGRYNVLSLDTPVESQDSDSSKTIGDNVADMWSRSPEVETICNILKEAVAKALGSLSIRDAEILRMRYGFNSREPMTLEEIGDRWNLSKERIRQIEDKALRKLKRTCPWLEDYLR